MPVENRFRAGSVYAIEYNENIYISFFDKDNMLKFDYINLKFIQLNIYLRQLQCRFLIRAPENLYILMNSK